jgi:BlaI family transcriptional regulator, penicillinase repressor
MVRRRSLTRLSAGEMELMRMLWEQGPLTLARAHQLFEDYGKAVAYPTMQTRLNRLVGKGFAARDDARPAAYRAAVSPAQTAAGVLRQVLDKLVQGSVAPLMSSLISERPLTLEEIRDIRTLLKQAEESNRKQSKRKG